jgi:hypothetical protein
MSRIISIIHYRPLRACDADQSDIAHILSVCQERWEVRLVFHGVNKRLTTRNVGGITPAIDTTEDSDALPRVAQYTSLSNDRFVSSMRITNRGFRPCLVKLLQSLPKRLTFGRPLVLHIDRSRGRTIRKW